MEINVEKLESCIDNMGSVCADARKEIKELFRDVLGVKFKKPDPIKFDVHVQWKQDGSGDLVYPNATLPNGWIHLVGKKGRLRFEEDG